MSFGSLPCLHSALSILTKHIFVYMQKQTTESRAWLWWKEPKTANHGLHLSRSTHSWRKTHIHWDGLKWVIQELKVFTFTLHYPKKTSSTVRNYKTTQLVSFTSNPNALIHLKPKRTHSCPLLDELDWLPVHQRITYKLPLSCSKLFLIFLHIIYPSLRIWVNQSAKVYVHNTIWAVCAHLKKLAIRLFSVARPRVWNCLPIQIRNFKSTDLLL